MLQTYCHKMFIHVVIKNFLEHMQYVSFNLALFFVFQTIAEYVNYVESEMKSCEEEECKLLCVRSMGNAGLAKFLPSLLNQALNSKSSTVSLTAIQGLRRMKISGFKDQVVTI